MDIKTALRSHAGTRLAFTGAGGKTTALFRLARGLLADCPSVLVTTTTHFSAAQAGWGDHHYTPGDSEGKPRTEAGLAPGICVFTGEEVEGGRVSGLHEHGLDALRRLADDLGAPLLIEADGSRMHPLKAPGSHEPAVPGFVDTVVVTAGLSGLGQPLDEGHVHRTGRFASLAGVEPGEDVSGEALARVLLHADGGLKGVPESALRIALLNQADDDRLRAAGKRLAARLSTAYDGVLVASLEPDEVVYAVHERIAAVILAAGASKRMGRPKQLLDWGGRPLVVHAAGIALAAGCDPVVVVTGAAGERVAEALQRHQVRRAHNPEWEQGQSTSVRAGLAALDRRVGGALFMLVDQPFVSAALLRSLIESHALSLAPITAPLVDGQRGNPVLFDRGTFPDFRTLSGDAGARQLFSRYRASWLPWHDPKVLLDIDSPADYARLAESL